MSTEPTTAAALVDFRRELIEGGYSADDAAHLAAVALAEILRGEGLHVRAIAEVAA